MNCGCRVANRQYEKEPDIEFCPLHSNAEGMRDALRLIHDVANEHICDLQAENGDWFTIEAESYAALHRGRVAPRGTEQAGESHER